MARWILAVATLTIGASPGASGTHARSVPGAATVTVALRATAGDGTPVVDLTREDVVLEVGGRPRAIQSIHAVHPGIGSLLPAPYASNSHLDRGRQLVFVLDEESFAPAHARLMRDAVTAAMTSISRRDRVGLLSIHPSGVSVAATRRHGAILAAVPDIRGRAIGRESEADLSCRTRRVLQALRSVFDAATDGAPLTVVLLSGLLAAPPVAKVFVTGTDGGCPLDPKDFDAVLASRARSGAHFAVLNLVDPGAPVESVERLAGLEKLGGGMDAEFARVIGDPASAVARVVGATAAYYLATFEADASDREGSTRPVEARTRRSGVTLLARPAVVIPRAPEKGDGSARGMTRVATPFRDLPLRAAAAPSRNPGDDKIKVVVMFEPEERGVAIASAAAALFDAKGRLVAEWTSPPADLAGSPSVAAMIVPPGPYRLRVAAVDGRGRMGAVDDDVDAGLITMGPTKVSGLVLGVPVNNSIAPRLQFGSDDTAVVAYLEVYGVPRGAKLSGALELGTSEREPPLRTAPAPATAIDNSDVSIVFGGFEIADLAPRDYLVTAILTVDGKAAGRALATLRKR